MNSIGNELHNKLNDEQQIGIDIISNHLMFNSILKLSKYDMFVEIGIIFAEKYISIKSLSFAVTMIIIIKKTEKSRIYLFH